MLAVALRRREWDHASAPPATVQQVRPRLRRLSAPVSHRDQPILVLSARTSRGTVRRAVLQAPRPQHRLGRDVVVEGRHVGVVGTQHPPLIRQRLFDFG